MAESSYAFSTEIVQSGWKLEREPAPLDTRLISVETKYGATNLGVAVADARVTTPDGPQGPTYLLAFGYEGRTSEAYQTQQWQALADHLKARVIMVDTPGFDDPSANALLTQRLYHQIAKGNFEPAAILMLRAIEQAALLDDNEEVGIIGYSMGTITGSTMARLLQDHETHPGLPRVRIHSVSLWDPTSPRSTFRLLRDITADKAASVDYYRSLNTGRYEWAQAAHEVIDPKGHMRRIRTQVAAFALYGLGIANASPSHILAGAIALDAEHEATGLSEGTIRVIHGTDSLIARPPAITSGLQQIRAHLRESGQARAHPLEGETHFWPHAVELPAAVAERVMQGDH